MFFVSIRFVGFEVRCSFRVLDTYMTVGLDFWCNNHLLNCLFLLLLVRRLRQASFFYAEVREPFNAEMMPELLLLDDKRKLERSLTTLLKSHIKQVILFCDQNDLTTIMNAVIMPLFLKIRGFSATAFVRTLPGNSEHVYKGNP